MSAALEIVLVDSGQSARSVAQQAGAYGPPSMQPGRSSTTSPDDASGKPGQATSLAFVPVVEGLRKFAGVLGVGGIFTSVVNVTKAMFSLVDAVQSASQAERQKAASQPPGTPGAPNTPAGSQPTAPQTPSPGKSSPSPASTQPANAGNPNIRFSGPPSASDPFAHLRPKAPPPAPVGPAPTGGLPAGAVAPGAVAPAVAPGAAGVGAAAGGVVAPPVAAGVPAAVGAPAAGAAGGAAGAAGLAAAAGPLAIVAAAAIMAAVGIKKFADVAHSEAERLGGLNAELAQANAMAGVRELQADMRRAERTGPKLAQFENDRSRVMTAMSDIGTSILSLLLDLYRTFRPMIETGVKYLELVAAGGEVASETVTGILDLLTRNDYKDNIVRANAALQKMARIMQNKEDDAADATMFVDQFLGNANGDALGNALRFGRNPGGAAPVGA